MKVNSIRLTELLRLVHASLFHPQEIMDQMDQMTSTIQRNITCHQSQINGMEQLIAKERVLNAQDHECKQLIILFLQCKLKEIVASFQMVLEKRQETIRHSLRIAPPMMLQSSTFFDDLDAGIVAPQDEIASMDMEQLRQVDPYLLQRSQAVMRVNQTLHELQGVFSKVLELTLVQGEQIERIDTNIQNALNYVEEGHGELLIYLESLRAGRYLIAKMFTVVTFCMVIFVLFFM